MSRRWVEAADLAHLPSLRNQWGQGHVNSDLSSLAWLAAPPYSFGYHTGVLRVDGVVLPAQRFRWKPWGVQREHAGASLTVRTDTRCCWAETLLAMANRRHQPDRRYMPCRPLCASQDLFAMVTHTDTGWGWLYDVPWTAGNYHDFMTLERIRASVTALKATRRICWGRAHAICALAGLGCTAFSRDADTEAMSLAYELPRRRQHRTPSTRTSARRP